ncbi:MAG TPA: translation initiation factor IF-2 N-terminal domain-containing protein, partial [Gemmataceae bacterium]|nr:translation initiation factor IF-2 N-terminal domain-containing protein [Gemmataceae bacterium]
MQKEKVRVYALARELNIESKDLLDLCRQHGIDVKNQLSSLDPDQRDAVELLVKRGGAGGAAVAVAPPPKAVASVIPSVTAPVRVLPSRPVRREPEPARPATSARPAEPAPAPQPAPPAAEPPAAAARAPETPAAAPRPAEVSPGRQTDAATRVPDLGNKVPPTAATRVPDLNQPRAEGTRPQRKREIPRPVVARVASPPPLKQRPLREVKKPQEPVAQKPIARPPMDALRGGSVNVQDILNKAGAGEVAVPVDVEEEEGADAQKGSKSRPGGVAGRDKRHQQRNDRARQRKSRGEVERQGGRLLLPVEDDRPQRVKQRLKQAQQRRGAPTQPRKGKMPIELPITVRALSAALGVGSGDLLFRLKDHGAGATVTINSTVDADLAEAIALDVGCELEVKRPLDAEGLLLQEAQQPNEPEDLVARAPVVTIMGHVDHGKTSLLDKIRKSNVVATEAGGITQVIRAWRVDHGGHPVTFLDTPGHEAFTKMRARGAHVTDIVVIVVAADDGVMPQTEEAISHAKAAEVPIVVAINKVDLPNANITKTRQQLYSLGLLPDNMGGDIPFVETSAATGKGIQELLDNLSVVAETLLELKANPSKPAQGTCLEAMLSEGEGVRATLLVQDGTLHRGDVILCGASYGRVRALYDDLGRPISHAGP